ncbi:hypothetical protein M501DRAFT_369171 [Patellaria atrata CBS 101060]|uniref:Uncharacterized protein n=1 Tax=Patellaria atrata CBS 101060 TaxID=1346257 RepID=A0A9P4VUG0_9PEZI|nr:hypothetical protein M501DRAFT_369171 [Patellaria atrata CBS 101060]
MSLVLLSVCFHFDNHLNLSDFLSLWVLLLSQHGSVGDFQTLGPRLDPTAPVCRLFRPLNVTGTVTRNGNGHGTRGFVNCVADRTSLDCSTGVGTAYTKIQETRMHPWLDMATWRS